MYALDPVPETFAPNRACASARAMRAKGRTARAQGKNRNDNPSRGARLCARICARVRGINCVSVEQLHTVPAFLWII